MSEINYTRASNSPIEGLILEVALGRDTIFTVLRLENDWKVLMNSSNPNKSNPVQISWQEFLEIVYEFRNLLVSRMSY
jgi:hypothetical protein